MDFNRYNRQIILPDFGTEGQQKLRQASVLIIGVGGLGCPASQVLAGTGVGRLGLLDFDTVELHNLHRQPLFNEKDIGRAKVEVAREQLSLFNSEVEIQIFNQKVEVGNIIPILQNYNVVVDCTDNFSTRYLINDACTLLSKPLVYGAIFRYEGQVSIFNVGEKSEQTNYRDLFPSPPSADEIPNCNEAGVLPTLPLIIGAMQANEVIKFITGSNEILRNRLAIFNAKTYETHRIAYSINTAKPSPKSIEDLYFLHYKTEDSFCGLHHLNTEEELKAFLSKESSVLIDVRERGELPFLTKYPALNIPLSDIENATEAIESLQNICCICASGQRSKKAVSLLKQKYPDKNITDFPKGVMAINIE